MRPPTTPAAAPPRAVGMGLFGPQHTERGAQLGTDQVLPPFAASEGEIRGLGPHPPGEDRQQLGVLVVRVRGDHEHTLVVTEEPQGLVERNKPARGRAKALCHGGWGGKGG